MRDTLLGTEFRRRYSIGGAALFLLGILVFSVFFFKTASRIRNLNLATTACVKVLSLLHQTLMEPSLKLTEEAGQLSQEGFDSIFVRYRIVLQRIDIEFAKRLQLVMTEKGFEPGASRNLKLKKLSHSVARELLQFQSRLSQNWFRLYCSCVGLSGCCFLSGVCLWSSFSFSLSQRESGVLSFTNVALRTLKKDGDSPHFSVHGYTERVLYALSNILLLATPDGSIQMVNEAFCRLLGYERAEILGQNLDLITDRALLSDPARVSVETSLVHKDGSLLPVLLSLSSVYDSDDKVDGLVFVAQDITELKGAERELQQKEQRLRSVLMRVVNAHEQAQGSFARDLHDGLLQLVISSEFHLRAYPAKTLRNQSEEGEEELNDAILRLGDVLAEGRRLINDLRPPTLDRFGLPESLESEVEKLGRELGCECQFIVADPSSQIPGVLETAIYRCCQEGLSNIRKHAKPNDVSVVLDFLENAAVLIIQDDGRGFDKERVNKGIGLESMRERAEMYGGEFELASEPGAGTTLKMTFPIEDLMC